MRAGDASVPPNSMGGASMDVTVGQTAHREMAVTEDMVAKYAEITGDYNPLHFDEEFVGQTRFGRTDLPRWHHHGTVARSGCHGHAWARNGFHKSRLVLSPDRCTLETASVPKQK